MMRSVRPSYPVLRSTWVSPMVLLVAGMALAGCVGMRMAQEMPDTVSLIEYLNKEGIATDHNGIVAEPFFSTGGAEYRLIGTDLLHVYEYEYEDQAQSDANRLDTWHTLRTGVHIYHRDTLIVVYYGRKANVKITLSNVLGPRLV